MEQSVDATALCQTLVVVLFLRRAFSSQHFVQKGLFWNVALPTWKTLLCCHEVTGQRANPGGPASFGRPAHSKTRTGPLFSGPSSQHGFLAFLGESQRHERLKWRKSEKTPCMSVCFGNLLLA